MAIVAGTTLGRYEVRSLVDAGGMGEVYLAQDTQLRRPVALKLLPGNFTQDEDRLRRFEQGEIVACPTGGPESWVVRRFFVRKYSNRLVRTWRDFMRS